jgi:hypothetical protein
MNVNHFAERCPTLDRRIDRGDDFAGDAWKIPLTEDVFYVAVGQFPPCMHYRQQKDGYKMLCNADGSRSIFDDVDE